MLRGSCFDKVLCQVLADSNPEKEYSPSEVDAQSASYRRRLFVLPVSTFAGAEMLAIFSFYQLFISPLRE